MNAIEVSNNLFPDIQEGDPCESVYQRIMTVWTLSAAGSTLCGRGVIRLYVTALLQEAFAKAAALPPAEQDVLASRLLAE